MESLVRALAMEVLVFGLSLIEYSRPEQFPIEFVPRNGDTSIKNPGAVQKWCLKPLQ